MPEAEMAERWEAESDLWQWRDEAELGLNERDWITEFCEEHPGMVESGVREMARWWEVQAKLQAYRDVLWAEYGLPETCGGVLYRRPVQAVKGGA